MDGPASKKGVLKGAGDPVPSAYGLSRGIEGTKKTGLFGDSGRAITRIHSWIL